MNTLYGWYGIEFLYDVELELKHKMELSGIRIDNMELIPCLVARIGSLIRIGPLHDVIKSLTH